MLRIIFAVVLLAHLPCNVFSWKYSPDRDFRVVFESGNITATDAAVVGKATAVDINCRGQLSWHANLLQPLTSTVQYELIGKQQQNGVLIDSVRQTRYLCEALRNPDRWLNIFGFHASTPNIGPCCPVQKGMYVLDNYDIDPRSFPKDSKLGRWVLQYTWLLNKKPFVKLVLAVNIQSIY